MADNQASREARAFFDSATMPFIDGGFASVVGASFAVDDSATGLVVGELTDGGAEAIDRAVRAARAALHGPWGRMQPVERERLMLSLATAVEQDSDLLGELESIESGKSIGVARTLSAGGAANWLRHYAGWATKIEGATIDPSFAVPPGAKHMAMTLMEPVGVVGAIVPWNFPLMIAVWKIAPALACGCTIVVKPPEETPYGCLRLAQIATEIGFPPGVINVVPGLGATAGAALARHPGIDKITFTGSTAVGKLIGHAAVENVTRCTLELGGKSPMVMLADMEEGSEAFAAGLGMFFNSGQVCTSASRLLIEESIYDRTLERLTQIADGMTLGSGRDPAAQIQPVVSAKHRDRINGFVNRAIAAGAQRVSGGRDVPAGGHYVAPTILHGAALESEIVREEVFGPVVAAIPVKDLDHAISLSNDSPYGLAASIWTRDLNKAMRFVHQVKAGSVWVNTHNLVDPSVPFGGFKQSGIGREHGREVLASYLETKSVVIRYG